MDWYVIFLIVLLGLFVVASILYKFVFLRSPKRHIPEGKNIVSPADGTIIEILPYEDTEELKVEKGLGKIFTRAKDIAKEGYMVSIFMGFFDVHINRAPITGLVQSIKHHKGRFRNANNPNVLMENEHTETIIVDGTFRVKVIQIAGFIARRIKTFIKKKQVVQKGQEMGMIVIGSQTTLIMPKGVQLHVKEGDKVYAGTTIIAERP